MDQILTLNQIEKRFESEWVLLADPVVDSKGCVTGGRVVAHSKNRDEVYRKAIELKLNRSATRYMGKMPKDTAIIL